MDPLMLWMLELKAHAGRAHIHERLDFEFLAPAPWILMGTSGRIPRTGNTR